jgi:hypothetical protein
MEVISTEGKEFRLAKELEYIEKYVPELYGKPTIWNYNTIIDMINNAYAELLPELKQTVEDDNKTWPPGIAEDKPVVFSFNPETRLISYYSPTSWFDQQGSILDFYCNRALQRLFPTFDFLYDGDEPDLFS